MPRTKKASTSRALAPTGQSNHNVVVTLNGDTRTLAADAVYNVPRVHPSVPGPWSGEHEKVAWKDAATGYSCIILRSERDGTLGGYVAVPTGHPLHRWQAAALQGLHIAVHNTVNYASECQNGMPENMSICHIPREVVGDYGGAGRPHDDAWWFGFSCDGPGDVRPGDRRLYAEASLLDGVTERTYRNEAFVREECTRLAAQLAAVAAGLDPIAAVMPRTGDVGHDPRRAGR